MTIESLEVEGASLAWEAAGDGPPLFLVHGLSESRPVWERQLPVFARSHRVHALDVRGFGDSETGGADGTPAQYARDLAAIIRHVAPGRRARVIGFSMGGVTAQRIAIDFPDLVESIVVASSSSAINEAGEAYFLDRLETARRGSRADFDPLNRSDAEMLVRGMPQDLAAGYVDLRVRSVRDPQGYAAACRAMSTLRAQPLLGELGRIACPALVVTGELDPSCPPSAAGSIHRRIPGSRLEILPGIGHLSHWQGAEAFNQSCLAFFTDLERKPVGH